MKSDQPANNNPTVLNFTSWKRRGLFSWLQPTGENTHTITIAIPSQQLRQIGLFIFSAAETKIRPNFPPSPFRPVPKSPVPENLLHFPLRFLPSIKTDDADSDHCGYTFLLTCSTIDYHQQTLTLLKWVWYLINRYQPEDYNWRWTIFEILNRLQPDMSFKPTSYTIFLQELLSYNVWTLES